MKKLLILILTLIMLVSGSAVTAASAYADDGEEPREFWATVNEYTSWSLNEREGFSVDSILGVDGSLPDGMHYEVDNMGRLIVSGTPYTAGDYRVNFTLEVNNGTDSWGTGFMCILHVEGPAGDIDLPTCSFTVEAGVYSTVTLDMSCAGHITNAKFTIGNAPDGMRGDWDSNGVYILGTPTTAGTYSFTAVCNADYSDTRYVQPCVITVKGNAAPVITKQPTGETIVEGGHDSFIAKADNATGITWRFVSPDTRTTIKASEGPGYFAGLQVSGTDKEQLVVSNVPLALDGWSAEAMFEGPGGTVYSNGAVIRVKRAELKAPVINNPPADANLKSGENITLTVSAGSPDGNRLSYQWYKADKAGDAKGEAIPGATSASYTVNYEEGTFYYYCMVYNNRDGEISAPARTASAKVVGAAAPTPAPSAESTPDPEPSAMPTEAPKETAAPEKVPEKSEKSDHTVAFIIGGVIAVAIICATLIVIQRGAAKRYPERYSEQIRRAEEYRKSRRHTIDK